MLDLMEANVQLGTLFLAYPTKLLPVLDEAVKDVQVRLVSVSPKAALLLHRDLSLTSSWSVLWLVERAERRHGDPPEPAGHGDQAVHARARVEPAAVPRAHAHSHPSHR